MRPINILTAMVAALFLTGSATAFAATPIKGSIVKGGKNLEAAPASDNATPQSTEVVSPRDAQSGLPTGKKEAAPATGATASGECDHAINTKGTGSTRTTAPNAPTPVDPKNPQCGTKVRTKSNQANE